MGLTVMSLAYPHGTASGATQLVASGCGYNSARNVSGLRAHAPESCTGCPYVETIPPAATMGIRTPGSVKSSQLATDLEQNVLDAEARGGGWVPFVIHHVCDGCNTDAISPAQLQALVTWLAARQPMGTTVKTVQEVIGGTLQPAVIAPAATPYAAPDGNLLRNSDLESFTNTGDLPDCVMSLTGGANGADYTVGAAPTSHSGSRAAQISFLPGKTGTPRIATLQDLGYCSPAAKSGDPLVFSFYYQATDPVAPVAYYRLASGWWKTLAEGAPLSPTAVWTASEWTLPALPADATAVSVGVTLLNTGTLAVDDFRLINLNGPPPAPDMAGSSDAGTVDGGTSSTDAGISPPDGDGGLGDLATSHESEGCAMAPSTTRGPILVVALFMLVLLAVRPRRR
jgi:MYXO-CTERM domain-containing protein